MVLPKLHVNRAQVLIGLAILLGAALLAGVVWAFGRQVALSKELQVTEQFLQQEVDLLQAHHGELVAKLEYVQSDEYAERWARTNAAMVKPGEVPVVVLTATVRPEAAQPQPAQIRDPRPTGLWDRLWQTVFGLRGRP